MTKERQIFKRTGRELAPLRVLVECGYIRIDEIQADGRPTLKIKVNPLAQK